MGVAKLAVLVTTPAIDLGFEALDLSRGCVFKHLLMVMAAADHCGEVGTAGDLRDVEAFERLDQDR